MWVALRHRTARPVLGAAGSHADHEGDRQKLRVNVMSAVGPRGALWFTVFTERFTAPVFSTFLDRVARQAGRKVHVVADRHPVHRSKAVRAWLKDNTDRVELHLMPGYSPKLNPDELRGPTSNATSTPPAPTPSTASPTRPVASYDAANANPHIVRGHFQAPHVRYAAM
ncbi:MAG: hypothetical protein HOV94_36675 [Saccharothrix sp.]|nr:hypothetical protein [Saccharothrix sp.]